MSCERNSNQAARAAKSSGISPGQSKFGRISGVMLGAARRGLGRSATAALSVVEGFDAPKSVASLGILVPLAALRGDKMRRQVLQWLSLAKVGQTAGVFAGTGLGRLSRIEKSGLVEGIEQRFFFKNRKLPVGMWQSRLTPWLNTRDVLGAGQAQASSGVMFEIEGKTWHRGTTTVKTPAGERTISHLQSLSLPASHYYFNRPLSDNEAVGIVAGQKGFEPKYMAGYAGQITEVESLSPAWASLKKGLIKTHLFWSEFAPSGCVTRDWGQKRP